MPTRAVIADSVEPRPRRTRAGEQTGPAAQGGGRAAAEPAGEAWAGWFTTTDCARFLGKSVQGLRLILARLAPRLGPEAIDREGAGRPTWVHGPTLVAAVVAEQVERARPVPGDEGLLTDGSVTSDNLERYRLAMAKLRELDLAERRGELLERRAVQAGFAQVAAHLRRAGETLGKHYGPAAAAVLERALDDAGRTVRTVLGAEEMRHDDGDGNEPAAVGGAGPGGTGPGSAGAAGELPAGRRTLGARGGRAAGRARQRDQPSGRRRRATPGPP